MNEGITQDFCKKYYVKPELLHLFIKELDAYIAKRVLEAEQSIRADERGKVLGEIKILQKAYSLGASIKNNDPRNTKIAEDVFEGIIAKLSTQSGDKKGEV